MRRLITFPCEGDMLVGTLDDAAGRTGLLIVSGGNEPRMGAHRGMALLAGRLAAGGMPVFRFDRRGIGDSSGENHGYAASAPDIAAAAVAFRAEASLTRLVAFGNCDAASALALFGRAAGIDAVILANPWVVETTDDLPPAAAIRARYAEKLRDPREMWRLLTGGVSLAKLVRGVVRLVAPRTADDLATRVLTAIEAWGEDATVILATGDATAIAYRAAAGGYGPRPFPIDTASHGFARPGDMAALETAILTALANKIPTSPRT